MEFVASWKKYGLCQFRPTVPGNAVDKGLTGIIYVGFRYPLVRGLLHLDVKGRWAQGKDRGCVVLPRAASEWKPQGRRRRQREAVSAVDHHAGKSPEGKSGFISIAHNRRREHVCIMLRFQASGARSLTLGVSESGHRSWWATS